MKFYVASLGCKLNQSEMDRLKAQLAAAGWEMVAAADAELIVLNTCAVTAEAARKSRQALRRLRAAAPAATLAATGCYAELWPAEVAGAAQPDLVVGNTDKERLAEILGALAPREDRASPRTRTRSFVKIQDGCDNACAYCVVHIARGPSRSLPIAQVTGEVQDAVAMNHREVVLTGVNIGDYRSDDGVGLGGLLAHLLRETRVERIRLSSVEPWSLQEEWLDLWQDPRLCRHLHLPLQSGSEAVLNRMNRPYSAEQFMTLTRSISCAFPDLAITTDVIVGFPGETEADHRATADLMRAVGFARAHVFPFSARPGTPAAEMRGAVPTDTVRRRAGELRALSSELASVFAARFVGKTLDVLWEQRRANGVWAGLTANYLRVFAQSEVNLANRITPARLEAPVKGGLWGAALIDKARERPV